MPRRGVFATYWLPLVLWMALIFGASSDALSSRNTSRVLEPLLRWLVPGITHRTIVKVHAAVRKTGHVLEYAVLAVLFWRLLRRPDSDRPQPWSWRLAFFALALACLYATTDELHQSRVRTRQGSAWDVAIDTGGAALGLGVVWLWTRRRRRPS